MPDFMMIRGKRVPRARWLAPPTAPMYCVRWVRGNREECAHRVYFHAWRAYQLRDELIDRGYDVHLYVTGTTWTKVRRP